MKMNQFKRELLTKEFPFLDTENTFHCYQCHDTDGTLLSFQGKGQSSVCPKCGYTATNYCYNEPWINADEIKIKRVDSNLLGSVPWSDSYNWSGGGYNNYSEAYAVTDSETIKLDGSDRWATGSGDRGESKADTIGGQLRTQGLNPDYIVTKNFEDTDANGNGDTFLSVVIYKNKGSAQTSYERKELSRAYREIEADIISASGATFNSILQDKKKFEESHGEIIRELGYANRLYMTDNVNGEERNYLDDFLETHGDKTAISIEFIPGSPHCAGRGIVFSK